MTNKEAIETLKSNYPDSRYSMLREAVDVAISALIEQDTRIREELFAAVQLIKKHCRNRADRCECSGCPLYVSIDVGCICRSIVPGCWPDPEEGGGEDA